MSDTKISALTSYTPALDADVVPIVDTANTLTKKISWANIKATLKTYFDGIYQAIGTYVTAITITSANGVSGSSSGGATPGLTIALGAITPSTVNGNTLTTGSYTLTGTAAKTLSFANTIALAAGADSQTFTFPATSATVAGLGTTQTFTGQDKFNNLIDVNNAIAASSNAATVPVTFRLNTVTNNSAATLTITMATTNAVDGQMTVVRILDSSAAAQTITWVNTENSTVSAPTTSNGSTTLFLSAGFIYNSGTSKWRCIASA